MKTFTAKQFSRAPAQVFDAAREDGEVQITHDRFLWPFTLKMEKPNYYEPNEKGPEGPDSKK